MKIQKQNKPEIIVTNPIKEQDITYRIIHAKTYKTVILATQNEETRKKELTIKQITNRTATELEDLFITYNPSNKDTAYTTKTYDNQSDIIIYNNLTHKLEELTQEHKQDINQNKNYELLKNLLQNLAKVEHDQYGTRDALTDTEWECFKQIMTEVENGHNPHENKLLTEINELKTEIQELKTINKKQEQIIQQVKTYFEQE